MPELEFHISKKLEKQCRDWCRKWFPCEAYGFVLGTLIGNVAQADQLWVPSEVDARHYFKKDRICFNDAWSLEIDEVLEEEGLMIIGDFHSHPYTKRETSASPVQSAHDIDNAVNYAVFGVCVVDEKLSGRLVCDLRWWGPMVKVRVVKE
jgi:proteasome lid subunit RPN8/RPN11